MRQGDFFQTCSFLLRIFIEVQASGLQFSFNVLQHPSTWHTIKENYKSLGY